MDTTDYLSGYDDAARPADYCGHCGHGYGAVATYRFCPKCGNKRDALDSPGPSLTKTEPVVPGALPEGYVPPAAPTATEVSSEGAPSGVNKESSAFMGLAILLGFGYMVITLVGAAAMFVEALRGFLWPVLNWMTIIMAWVPLVGIIFMGMWLYSQTEHLRRLGHSTTFSPGWAWGGWFIPLANLFIPFMMSSDLDRGRTQGAGLGGTLAAATIGSALLVEVASIVVNIFGSGLEGYYAIIGGGSALLWLLWCMVAEKLGEAQEHLNRLGPA